MRDFEILFDDGEPSPIDHPGYAPYGKLGFPAPPDGRPWTWSNFVQSLDGIASLRGQHPSGLHIARSEEDAWLMDLLRAHADALLMGMRTLVDDTAIAARPGFRGPLFAIRREPLLDLRRALGKGRERLIFVTAAADVEFSRYAVFDGDRVDSAILTTRRGAELLEPQRRTHPHVRILAAGEGQYADLRRAMRMLRQELGIGHLLCEGGPVLNSSMTAAGLLDERFLTIAPVEFGQMAPEEQERSELEPPEGPIARPTTFPGPGFTRDSAPWWRWMSCRRVGDHQFNRYRKQSKRA